MGPAEGTSRVASSVRKKRPARVLFAALLFIVFYFVLFPYPLGTGDSSRIPAGPSPFPRRRTRCPCRRPARRGRSSWAAGSASSRVTEACLYAGTALYRVALSSAAFVNYTRLGTDWILQDTSGRRIASFSGSGYPLLGPDGSRLFNVKSDLSGIIELDRTGECTLGEGFSRADDDTFAAKGTAGRRPAQREPPAHQQAGLSDRSILPRGKQDPRHPRVCRGPGRLPCCGPERDRPAVPQRASPAVSGLFAGCHRRASRRTSAGRSAWVSLPIRAGCISRDRTAPASSIRPRAPCAG